MARGLQAVIDTAFQEMGVTPARSNIQPGNKSSIALVKKLGFSSRDFPSLPHGG